jgi:hypothetical protein
MATVIVNGLQVQVANYKVGKSHNPQSWTFAGLHAIPLLSNASIGAGLTGSTKSGAIVLPQYCKIPKVAVAYSSIDLFNGTETFNIVVEAAGDGTPAGAGTGFGATYTAGAVQGVGYADNSTQWGYPAQNALGVPPNFTDWQGPVFAPVGACLFTTDVPFSVATFTSGSTSGGVEVIATTNYDGVYAAGTVLSIRFVTTASTGAIANCCVTLLAEVLDDYISDDASVPITNW